MHSKTIRQRRRRVTLEQTQAAQEELDAADDGESPKPRTKRRSSADKKKAVARPYTHGARRSKQFKTTDLIPKRIWSMAALIALLFSAIAGLNLLHLNSPDWINVIGSEGVAAFSLDSGRGIGVWYSNFLLLMTSCVSLQLYLLRQHRRDDYKGSYRIWMWLAMIFLMASAASVTGISSICRNLFTHFISTESVGSGLFWVFLIKLVCLAMLIVRGLIEVRYSRLAVVGLLVVLLAYGTASLVHEVPDVQVQSKKFIHAALGNCLLLGCTSLFIAVLGFARFVYLDANGLIKSKPAEDSSRPERKTAKAEARAAAKQQKMEAKQQKAEAKAELLREKQEKRESAALEKQMLREQEQQEREQRKQARKEEKLAGSKKTEASDDASADKVAKKKKKAEAVAAKKAESKKRAAKKQETKPATDTQQTSDTQQEKRVGKRAAAAKKNKATKDTANVQQATQTAATEEQQPVNLQDMVEKQRTKSQRNKKQKSSSGQLTGDEYLLSIDDAEFEGLSKSERRRLKKLKRREGNRAA